MTTLEFPWIKSADSTLESICLKTENRSLGEALALTSVPSRLKAHYPEMKVYIHNRGYNSAAFKANPYVDSLKFLDSNEDPQIRLTEPIKPEIYVTPQEQRAVQNLIESKRLPSLNSKPLCILHARGSATPPLAIGFWDTVAARWSEHFRFWQVGFERDLAIQNCEYYHLLPPSSANARKLFALVQQADIFVGIESTPMHVARAFDKPSLILLNQLASTPDPRRHYIHSLFEYSGVNESEVKIDQFLNRFKTD